MKRLYMAVGVCLAACNTAPATSSDGGGADGACMMSALRPSARKDVDVVVVPGAQRLLAYGGDLAPFNPMASPTYQLIEEFWQLDLSCGIWSRVSAPSTPGARAGYAATFDSKRNRLLMFGGRVGTGANPPLSNDVWAFDVAAATWSKLSTSGTGPTPRVGHAATYDPETDSLIVFGGDTSTTFGNGIVSDAYALGFSASADGAWTQINASGANSAPSPRRDAAIAVDPTHKSIVLFDGALSFTAYSNELWTLGVATKTWKKVATTGDVPTARFRTRMVYDAARTRFVTFGGHDPQGLGLQNATVAFSLDAAGSTATFTTLIAGDTDLMTPDHSSPERRDHHGLIVSGDSLMTLWGSSDCGPLDDVWSLNLASPTAWMPVFGAMVGETCVRRAKAGQTCPSDCGNPL